MLHTRRIKAVFLPKWHLHFEIMRLRKEGKWKQASFHQNNGEKTHTRNKCRKNGHTNATRKYFNWKCVFFFLSFFYFAFCSIDRIEMRQCLFFFPISRNCAPNVWKHLGVGRCREIEREKRFSIVQLQFAVQCTRIETKNHYFHTFASIQ